jgi:hypothetical protein
VKHVNAVEFFRHACQNNISTADIRRGEEEETENVRLVLGICKHGRSFVNSCQELRIQILLS